MNHSECDIALPTLNSPDDELRASQALHHLPGIEEVRIVTGGAWIAYRADTIHPEVICEALRHAGFRASIFQDSASGRTGRSST